MKDGGQRSSDVVVVRSTAPRIFTLDRHVAVASRALAVDGPDIGPTRYEPKLFLEAGA